METNVSYIYALSSPSKPNDYRYVGATSRPFERFQEHKTPYSRRNKCLEKNIWIDQVLALEGNLIMTPVRCVASEEMWNAEEYTISLLREQGHALTNVTSGGRGYRAKKSAHSKNKQSATRKKLFSTGELQHSELFKIAASKNITAYNKSEAHKEVAKITGHLYGTENLIKATEKRLLKPEIKEAIMKLTREGMDANGIVKELGISLPSIYRVRRASVENFSDQQD